METLALLLARDRQATSCAPTSSRTTFALVLWMLMAQDARRRETAQQVCIAGPRRAAPGYAPSERTSEP